MENTRTISELKTLFIRNQVRVLSAPIAPQEGWRDYAPETEDNLSDKIVEEVLQKLNSTLKQHNRVVYSNQAIQHIARQIESLYWDSVRKEATGPIKELSGIELGSDLSNHHVIEKLPEQYAGDDISSEEDRNRQVNTYEVLYKRLVALDARRQAQQKRLAQYKQLEALLEPLKYPQENIQPNLITRDGELIQEIDKMRMLMARVAGRIRRAPPSQRGTESMSDQRSQQQQAETVEGSPSRAPSLPSRPVSRSFAVFAQDDLAFGSMIANGASMGNFVDNSSNVNMTNMARQSPSPAAQHAVPQVNGGGPVGNNMMAGIPMNAGHQMDLNNLYEMVVEFSDVLRHNREMTRGIVASAEELMRRSTAEGASPDVQQIGGEISAARIAELERALAKERHTVEILKREQAENTKLIGEFESTLGVIVEQIRNYCQDNNMYFLAQKKDYNALLQAERDAHLASRLDRDHWHAQTMRLAEMLRTAYRLRCEEDVAPTRVVQALQSEVRALRSAIGLPPEKPEEEAGYGFLKDLPSAED